MDRSQIIDLIDRFLADATDKWEWDDFTSVRIRDKSLEEIRKFCAFLPFRFPPTEKGHYCSPEGFDELAAFVQKLKQEDNRGSSGAKP